MSCQGCGAPIEYPKCSYCGRIPLNISRGPSAEEIAKAIWDTPIKNYISTEDVIFTSTGMVPRATTLLKAMGLDLEKEIKEEKNNKYKSYWENLYKTRKCCK
jgi:hypothetical protein